jgi:hypothetical protein
MTWRCKGDLVWVHHRLSTRHVALKARAPTAYLFEFACLGTGLCARVLIADLAAKMSASRQGGRMLVSGKKYDLKTLVFCRTGA